MSPIMLDLPEAMRPKIPGTLDILSTGDVCGCPTKKKGSLKREGKLL